MLLQLIITHYKDDQKYVKRLLDSIKLQQDIDFNDIGVMIINDGNEVILDSSLFSEYDFNIEYYIEEWSGVSGARQHGQDRATADYIMFCDGDDLFYRMNALWEILRVIKTQHPDIITSRFKTDMFESGNSQYECDYFKEYNLENVWIHGKVFKKEFLNKYNIKWNPKLKIYEDSYYVRLCFSYAPNKINIDETIWFWKYRTDSITRSDDNWATYTYTEKMDSNAELVKQFVARNKFEDAYNYAYVQLHECYFTLLEDYWNCSLFAPYKEKIEKATVKYWRQFGYLAEKIDDECAEIIMGVLRKRFYTDRKRISLEDITYKDWLKDLIERYGKEI